MTEICHRDSSNSPIPLTERTAPKITIMLCADQVPAQIEQVLHSKLFPDILNVSSENYTISDTM
jgi:hypothetical protein